MDRIIELCSILQEFDEPLILLQKKSGHFYDLVNQTKGDGSEYLCRLAEEVIVDGVGNCRWIDFYFSFLLGLQRKA